MSSKHEDTQVLCNVCSVLLFFVWGTLNDRAVRFNYLGTCIHRGGTHICTEKTSLLKMDLWQVTYFFLFIAEILAYMVGKCYRWALSIYTFMSRFSIIYTFSTTSVCITCMSFIPLFHHTLWINLPYINLSVILRGKWKYFTSIDI